MREHSIIFSGEMVRATLDGRKTQTRRVVAWSNSYVDGQISKWWREHWSGLDFDKAWVDPGPSPAGNAGPYLHVPYPENQSVHRIYPRYQPGDRLWIKEKWRIMSINARLVNAQFYTVQFSDLHPLEYNPDLQEPLSALAAKEVLITNSIGDAYGKWRSPYHMSRQVCRITLDIKDVRGERLQEIAKPENIGDIEQEGISPSPFVYRDQDGHKDFYFEEYLQEFIDLWNSLNAKRGYPWKSNHWVWGYEFEKVERKQNGLESLT